MSLFNRSLYNKKDNTNLQERLVEYETNQFVACNTCGQVGSEALSMVPFSCAVAL